MSLNDEVMRVCDTCLIVLMHSCCNYFYRHVGTTTLSAKKSYSLGNSSSVHFCFEASCYVGRQMSMMTAEYKKCDLQKEINFVRNIFAPMFKKAKIHYNASVMVDMGHSNIYYYRGLIEYFTKLNPNNKICNHITFVRVRRNRYETMRSLMYQGHDFTPLQTIFYRYYPTENEANIILKLPDQNKAELLNGTNPFFWYIDEVEARWQKLLQDTENNPAVSTMELYWSSSHPEEGSMADAIGVVAQLLGDDAHHARKIPKLQVHFTRHRTRVAKGTSDFDLVKRDKLYRELMQFDTKKMEMLRLSQIL